MFGSLFFISNDQQEHFHQLITYSFVAFFLTLNKVLSKYVKMNIGGIAKAYTPESSIYWLN